MACGFGFRGGGKTKSGGLYLTVGDVFTQERGNASLRKQKNVKKIDWRH